MKYGAILAAMLLSAVLPAQAGPQQQNVEERFSHATQLMKQQLFESAAGEFEQVLAARPSDARARFDYAVCLLSMGRNEEARAQFERLEKQTGASRIITYYLGRLDLLSNDYESAIKRLSAVAKNPPVPDAAFQLGIAYVSSGDVADGIKWLERSAAVLPNDYRVHYRLARAYSTAERKQDADREYSVYNKLLSEHKNTEGQVRECADALRGQDRAAARSICQRMYDPNDADKLTLLGQLYGEAGDFEDAALPLTRATQLDSNSYEAWHDLGLTYFREEKYSEARAPLERAVALQPDAYGQARRIFWARLTEP